MPEDTKNTQNTLRNSPGENGTSEELMKPLETIKEAMDRSSVRRSLENNVLDMSTWELMKFIEHENGQNKVIRKLLHVLLGDDPDIGDVDIVDRNNVAQLETLENSIFLLQEVLSYSDETIHLLNESRSKLALAIEQRSQLKTRLLKVYKGESEDESGLRNK
ncbi:hypothetical protein H4219_001100 [Mycoemilia scoparia]|uniref:Transcriptional regulatory protein RXT2 N-terminal domain-containing protein n=1 Tax=Mycoemilia scoparia TaxID=417184 RepID=A0A9W8A1S2_9FUNG|nr:hypothetical protein H4219_001100 [Mycoemilia scoparia]